MKKLIFLFCILVVPMIGSSQKTLKEWADLDEKKWGKQLAFNDYLTNLKRYVKSEDQKPKVKNIGLLTFYMFTPSPTQRNINLLSPAHITGKGSSFIVDELFEIALPALQKGFEEKGILLMDLNGYLDDDRKKQLYNETEFEPSTLAKGTAAWAAKLSGRAYGGDAKATPDGYKLITETNWDIKMMRTTGDFAKKVDIDAVISVMQQINWDGKNLYLGPTVMSMIGPNPIPENDDDWYAPVGPLKGYLEGFIFGAVVASPPKAYLLGETSKKSIEINFDDLDLVYTRLASSLSEYVFEKIDKLVK